MNSTVRIFIVDDEQQACSTLKKLLAIHCQQVEVVGESHHPDVAKPLLETTDFDLLMLDINLGQRTGFDLLNELERRDFQLVFTTAYDEFALKAFKYHAIDYLLKPIDPDALVDVIHRVRSAKQQVNMQQLSTLLQDMQQQHFDRITVSTIEGTSFLPLSAIIRLESDRSYTTFYLESGKKVTVSRSIKDFEEILPAHQFFRIHQSHIINLKQVDMIVKKDGGYVLMRDQAQLPVSRRRKNELFEVLNRGSLKIGE